MTGSHAVHSRALPPTDETWLSRAARYIHPRDLLPFTPPGVALALFRLATRSLRDDPADEGLDRFDPEFARFVCDTMRIVGEKYFRWRVLGVDNVPPEGPVLLVGSHNGGVMVTDSALTLVALYDRFGYDRVVHPLSHDVLHAHPILRDRAARMGVLRAGHRGAERALERGRMVLVYPGSDLDATRPFRDRYRAELGGRTGFAKLAIRTGATVVPIASAGTHEQLVVLTRGDRIARALDTKRWIRIETFPLVFALPWGITLGYLPYLPLPAQTTISFGEPLRWPDLTRESEDDPDAVARVYRDVEAGIQHELDRVAEGRVPFLGA